MAWNPACLLPTAENLYYPPKRGDYTYFASPLQPPGASRVADASLAADVSMLAYARYGAARMTEKEFSGILRDASFAEVRTFGDCFFDNANTARGFFAFNDDRAVLAFRGTEEGNLHDFAADADLLLIHDSELRIDGPAGTARVHRGFHQYLLPVWPRVRSLVDEYRRGHPTQEICITGHSLGGALATLAFAYLRDSATSLYTFGCPRVGDRVFCGFIEAAAKTQRCCRVVDNLDIVALVPFRGDYQHPRIGAIWLNAKGRLIVNPARLPGDRTGFRHLALWFLNRRLPWLLSRWLPRPLADHSPVRYCHWIAEACTSTRA